MRGHAFSSLVRLLLLPVPMAGCTSSSLPTLPAPQPGTQTEKADIAHTPIEVVSIVPGSPTEVYVLVARGAFRCWFGADGPLKPTHVFHADADSPAKGGGAEIVLHERDETIRDKKGTRAVRIGISSAPGGVRVVVALPKMEQQLGPMMAKEVEAWARGGTDCELRKQVTSMPLTPAARKDDAGSERKR
jgi:hypothetical protein